MALPNYVVNNTTIVIAGQTFARGLFDSGAAFSKSLPGVEVLSMPILRLAASDVFNTVGLDYDIDNWQRLVVLVLSRLAITSPEQLTNSKVLFAAVCLEGYFPVLRDGAANQKITTVKNTIIADVEASYEFMGSYLVGNAPTKAGIAWAGTLIGNLDLIVAQMDWQGLVRNITARNCLVASLVTLAKRGTITAPFRDKVVQDIRRELNLTVHLDPEVVANVYHSFGRWVTPELAQALLATWGTQLPTEAQRLRLVLDRAGGSGLTSLILVGKAISLFPDFVWGRLNAFPDYTPEYARVDTAMTTVQANGYFMYDHGANTQVCKGTAFPSLVYVAKTLLETHMGQTTLRAYGGNRSAIKSKSYLDSLLKDYGDNRAARMHDQTVPPLVDLPAGAELVSIRASLVTYAALYAD